MTQNEQTNIPLELFKQGVNNMGIARLLGMRIETLEEGDLVLTEAGNRFAEAGVLEEKKVFRVQTLAHVSILRQIVQALEAAPRHVLPEEHFLQFLELHFNEAEAQAQLETAINWGRYAELFTFQENRGMFQLEEESKPVRPV